MGKPTNGTFFKSGLTQQNKYDTTTNTFVSAGQRILDCTFTSVGAIDAATERYTLVLKLTLFNSNATTSAGYETVYAPATWVGSSTGGSITFSLLGDSEFGTVTYTAAGRQALQLNLSNQTYGYTVANLFQ